MTMYRQPVAGDVIRVTGRRLAITMGWEPVALPGVRCRQRLQRTAPQVEPGIMVLRPEGVEAAWQAQPLALGGALRLVGWRGREARFLVDASLLESGSEVVIGLRALQGFRHLSEAWVRCAGVFFDCPCPGPHRALRLATLRLSAGGVDLVCEGRPVDVVTWTGLARSGAGRASLVHARACA